MMRMMMMMMMIYLTDAVSSCRVERHAWLTKRWSDMEAPASGWIYVHTADI